MSQVDGSADVPSRPRFSWDLKTVPWTDGRGDQREYVEAVALWEQFHDNLPSTSASRIDKKNRGIVLLSNLYGRARSLTLPIKDKVIAEPDNAVQLITSTIYKKDALSSVTLVHDE